MSITRLLGQTGTIRKQRTGAGAPGPDIDTAVACRFRPQAHTGDHTAELPHVLVVESGVDVDARDLFLDGSDIYEILPDPVNAQSPRGVNHITAHCLPLPDTCTITADAGRGTFNDTTLQYDGDPADTQIHVDIPCRLSPWESPERVVVAGEDLKSLRTYELAVPWSKTGIKVGHFVQITASSNPDTVNTQLEVVDVAAKSQAAAQRLVVREERRR